MPVTKRYLPGHPWARAHLKRSADAMAAWAFQERLEQSQWHGPRQHLAFQLKCLSELIRHGVANVPFHRDVREAVLAARSNTLDMKAWRRIPLVTRKQLQEQQAAFTAVRVPPHRGRSLIVKSSGSTGTPVETLIAELAGGWNRALLLRGHLWAFDRFDGRMAVIRRYKKGAADYPKGLKASAWMDETTLPAASGPVFGLNAETPVAEQIEWLNRVQPAILFTYPTQLAALLDEADRGGLKLPDLKRIMTISETLDDEVREAARRVFGAEVFDVYSANETGTIALQCPDGLGYHVQSEAMLVEVLDEKGEPCRAGATGRVVVTLLHSYAFPLIRYEIGDLATVGPACRCGRGLATLTRVVGRQRK